MMLHYVICLLSIETVYTCDLLKGNKKQQAPSQTLTIDSAPKQQAPSQTLTIDSGPKQQAPSQTLTIDSDPKYFHPKYFHVTPQVPSPNGIVVDHRIPVPNSGSDVIFYIVTHYQDDEAAEYCKSQLPLGVLGDMAYVTLVDTVNYFLFQDVVLDAFCVLPREGPIKKDFFRVFCACERAHAFELHLSSNRDCMVVEYKIHADPSSSDQSPKVEVSRTHCENIADRKALCKQICPDEKKWFVKVP